MSSLLDGIFGRLSSTGERHCVISALAVTFGDFCGEDSCEAYRYRYRYRAYACPRIGWFTSAWVLLYCGRVRLDDFRYLRIIWWLRNWPRSGFFLLSASACCANAFSVYHVYTPTHYGTSSAVYYRQGRHGGAPHGTALHGTAPALHCTPPFFYVMPSPENYAYIIMCFDHLNSWGCREAQLP